MQVNFRFSVPEMSFEMPFPSLEICHYNANQRFWRKGFVVDGNTYERLCDYDIPTVLLDLATLEENIWPRFDFREKCLPHSIQHVPTPTSQTITLLYVW